MLNHPQILLCPRSWSISYTFADDIVRGRGRYCPWSWTILSTIVELFVHDCGQNRTRSWTDINLWWFNTQILVEQHATYGGLTGGASASILER